MHREAMKPFGNIGETIMTNSTLIAVALKMQSGKFSSVEDALKTKIKESELIANKLENDNTFESAFVDSIASELTNVQ